jgi:hypothetical protein
MKKIVLFAALVATISLGACTQTEEKKVEATGAETPATAAVYECPMACEKSDKPGKCSKCEMDLVKK